MGSSCCSAKGASEGRFLLIQSRKKLSGLQTAPPGVQEYQLLRHPKMLMHKTTSNKTQKSTREMM